MARRILVTGGAGFIGSHVCDDLLAHGYDVRALDALAPQVHGARERPSYLDREVELVVGDIRDAATVARALEGVDSVVHLAALVGVGQSMYDIAAYTAVNDFGAAVLLEAISRKPVERLVVASSMSIYGEGLARTADGRIVSPSNRPAAQLRDGAWELRDADGAPLEPAATPESKSPTLNSVYALNKYVQEQLFLLTGAAYRIPTVALRLFNVYGPRQALSNPYTGVLAIFASRLLNDRAPVVFEDGLQQRDFVHVADVARAFRLALLCDGAAGHAINIGSGAQRTIRSVADDLASELGKPHMAPQITGRYRVGDIRHCFADVEFAVAKLGFEAQTTWREGLAELTDWLAGQVAEDKVDQAREELARRGLVA